jgi:hypothetical protein
MRNLAPLFSPFPPLSPSLLLGAKRGPRATASKLRLGRRGMMWPEGVRFATVPSATSNRLLALAASDPFSVSLPHCTVRRYLIFAIVTIRGFPPTSVGESLHGRSGFLITLAPWSRCTVPSCIVQYIKTTCCTVQSEAKDMGCCGRSHDQAAGAERTGRVKACTVARLLCVGGLAPLLRAMMSMAVWLGWDFRSVPGPCCGIGRWWNSVITTAQSGSHQKSVTTV